jgi:hypothetical protein
MNEPMPNFATLERFYSKALVGDGCWEWTAAKNKSGYGRFGVHGVNKLAHRVAYWLEHGEIPEGMHVLHRCDNPSCIRPGHLFLGTDLDNSVDMAAKGRARWAQKGSTHWKAKLSEESIPEIRRRHESGDTWASIGRSYGIDGTAARRAATGYNWSHVSKEVSH